MASRALFIIASLLLAPLATTASAQSDDAVRAAIVAAVTERLGTITDVQVGLLSGASGASGALAADRAAASIAAPNAPLARLAPLAPLAPGELKAVPAVGGRLGHPVRFVITPASGKAFTVLARVTAVVGHVVAARPLARDVAPVQEDLEWRHAQLDDVLLDALPGLDEVVAARTRRTIAAGEVVTRNALVRPYAVRAGDTVRLTVRSGAIEVRGVGRAVSSGFIGDVIRILPPGTRQPSRARVIAPAAVEILQ